MTADDTTRAAALKLLRRGLATQSEVAGLVGVSRQAVRLWVAREDFDPTEVRRAWLQATWRRALMGRR
jgi:hypothetical protein